MERRFAIIETLQEIELRAESVYRPIPTRNLDLVRI